MTQPGSDAVPLRVAVVGAGPAGFYAAELLLKSSYRVQTDLFESLPSPYGLVRYGVAPDHPKMRTVISRFDRTGANNEFSYFGNTAIGRDISLEDLRTWYDAIIITTGAQQPRQLGIPGENLPGSYTARPFIDWYNAYPDFTGPKFDLSCDTAVVIGNGNVALDIGRALTRTNEKLATTDMAARAVEALAQSNVRTVYIVGRRGPVQSSFTYPEIKELDDLSRCDIVVDPADLDLEEADRTELEMPHRAQARKFFPRMEGYAAGVASKERRIIFRFLRSPTRIDGTDRVERIVLQKNKLQGEPGKRKAASTDETETIDCGLVISCIGYKGTAIEGIPFDEKRGIIPNERGRVVPPDSEHPGLYVSGWIKRGPEGVIGTNKVDSKETVANLLDDVSSLAPCGNRDSEALRAVLLGRGCRPIDYQDWLKISAAEEAAGKASGKPRERLTTIAEMLKVID